MRKLISPWADHLMKFYEYKKLSGYKYEKSESVLYLFDRYYFSLQIDELLYTRDIIEPFLYLKPNERIGTQSGKASILRQFGKYLFLHDLITNIYIIPPISKKGESEYIPYIFDKNELVNIVTSLENYDPPNIPGTFFAYQNSKNSAILALKILMSTGMRLGEVLNLKLQDIDFANKLLIINVSKNDNKRIIPISNVLTHEIQIYIKNTPYIIYNNDYLLTIDYENKLSATNIRSYYYKALKLCNIARRKGFGPRIHDFRHTYAVMALTQLQTNEDNVNLSLSYLSSYLGHKSIKETQKYLWLTPMLYEETKSKMEQYTSFISKIFGGEKFYD